MEDQPRETDRRRAKKGLVIVHTGKGKGKTTAALGLVFRAWGHGMRVCVLQFIKRKNLNLGEVKAAAKLGLEWHQMGDGFTWRSADIDETVAKARRAWVLVQEKIASGAYDLIVLDPPPLARRRADVPRAARAYKDLLLRALRAAAPGAELFFFRCSAAVDAGLFRKITFGASRDAQRPLQVLGAFSLPVDHPVALDHPEGDYFGGLWLRA